METKIVRRSPAKPKDYFTVKLDDDKKNINVAPAIDFWDKLAVCCQNFVDRFNWCTAVFILFGAFALALIISGIVHIMRQDEAVTYVLNASLSFESVEYDFHVHDAPVTFSEAIKILNSLNGSRLLDYNVIRPDIIRKLEDSLSKDVPINPNEPDAAQLLLGTNLLIWTSAFFDWSTSKSYTLRHYNDTTTTKLAQLPGINKGQCHSGRHYEHYMNSNRLKNTGDELYFRIAIQINCKAQKTGDDFITRRCSGTCATMVADGSSSPRHLVAFYNRKPLPKIDVDKPLLRVRSADNSSDYVFHGVKVTKEGLERIIRHVGAEKLSVSLFSDDNFEKIAQAFKEVRGLFENQQLTFWTSGYFNFTDMQPRQLNWGDTTSEINDFKHWCNHRDVVGDEPDVALERHLHSFVFSEVANDDDHIHDVQLRVRDFYHESFRHDPPCLLMDGSVDQIGETMFHLAYRLPIN